jgi:tetratricopeptide (TPR) repeat protein
VPQRSPHAPPPSAARACLAALTALLALAGCEPAPSKGLPTAAASSSAAEAPPDRAAAARSLALAKAEGPAPVDQEIRALQQSLARMPRKTDFWIVLGQKWVRKARETTDPGYYLNARACAEVALDLEPGYRLALDLQSLVLLNDHKFAEAAALAEDVLRTTPDDVLALGTLSDAALEMGHFQDAVAAAQKMNDFKPGLPAYARGSYLRWLQGDTQGAKTIIRKAMDAKDPRDPEPYAWVLTQAALIFWHEGDHEGAEKGFDQALDAVKDYPPALVGKARCALGLGDPKRAVTLLEKAHAQSPLVETAWLLADAREAAGDARGAEEAQALVVKHGRQIDARTLALFFATKNRDLDEALRLLEAEKKTRDDLYTEDALAWTFYRKGRLAEARTASEAALSLGTKDARLLYHAGAIKIAAGDRAKGEALVREALKLNPAFDRTGVEEARKLVEAGKGAGGR